MVTLATIAEKTGGSVEGDDSIEIGRVAGIREAGAGDISFVSRPRYAAMAAETKASAVIVAEDWDGRSQAALLRVKNVERACSIVALLLAPPAPRIEPGAHPTAVIANKVLLGIGVSIGAHCVLETGVRVGDRTVVHAGCYLGHDTEVGEDCILYPHVTTRERTRIGNRAIIHNGAVLGSDGFGFVPEEKDGRIIVHKIPHTGVVEIGDDVEIGANVTIDRARFGRTRIGNNVKIDNLVHIAHNVEVGDYSGMAAQVGISGSTSIGSRVMLWGQAGVAGHLRIGDGAVIGAQAGVTKDVPAGTYVSGYPAMPHDKAARTHAGLMRLPHLKKRVEELEKRLSELQNRETCE